MKDDQDLYFARDVARFIKEYDKIKDLLESYSGSSGRGLELAFLDNEDIAKGYRATAVYYKCILSKYNRAIPKNIRKGLDLGEVISNLIENELTKAAHLEGKD